MASRSKYSASLDVDRVWFTNRYNGGLYGYVEVGEKPFPVRFPDGELVGTVNSLCDALPLIFIHFEQEYLEHRRRRLEQDLEAARFFASLRPLGSALAHVPWRPSEHGFRKSMPTG